MSNSIQNLRLVTFSTVSKLKNKVIVKGNNYFVFPFLLFTFIWLYIFLSSRILESGFNYFLDDHQIFKNYTTNFDFYKIVIDPFSSLFSNEPKSRFRPLYDVFVRLFSYIYGLNPFLWYLSSLIIAIATTTNFYAFARLQAFPLLESICFSLLIVFGTQASTYARFGTPETTSTFFISLAFLFCSLNINKNIKLSISLDFLFVFFAVLAALNKEACILMLPGLAFFKVWFFSQKNKISINKSFLINKYVVLLMLSIFFLFIAYIKFAGVSGPGYAGVDQDTFSISHILGLFKSLTSSTKSIFAFFALAIIINLAFLCLNTTRLNRFHLGFYTLSGLIIFPQLILYSKSGIYYHYLLPCVIGVSFLTIYPLVEIKKTFFKYYVIFILLIILIIAKNFVFTHRHFSHVSNKLNNMQEMVQDTKSCLKENSQLIVFGNPYTHYEALDGYKSTIVDKILKSKENNVILATYGHSNSNLKSDVLKEDEKSWSFLNTDDVEAWYNNKIINTLTQKELKETQSIVIFGSNKFENDFKILTSDWFNSNQFNYKYYQDLDISIYCKK